MTKIPDLNQILKPTWAHKVGYKVNATGWHKMKVWKQATNPRDKNILKKLGIKRGDKILAVAGYYGNWASELQKKGAKVTYSDISGPMVNHVKKKYKSLFENYICSNYELIPKQPGEFDWTFTFEACGGKQGLPIAFLRSLLNNKGGILVFFWNAKKKEAMGGKPKSYPLIVRTLARIYGAKEEIKNITFKAYKEGVKVENLLHKVHFIKTNPTAREKAEFDIAFLWSLKDKIAVKIDTKEKTASLKRLTHLTKMLNKEFIKNIKIK